MGLINFNCFKQQEDVVNDWDRAVINDIIQIKWILMSLNEFFNGCLRIGLDNVFLENYFIFI